MVSLAVHLILGLAVIAWIVNANRDIFTRPATGPNISALEATFYLVGIAGTVIGYYFNYRYVAEYATPSSNPIWGPGSWQEFINVILLPLFTIVDGYRRGIKRPWLYFVSSLFTSCAFAYAFYFATLDRQHRHQKALTGVGVQ
jgi:hypothetical protein